MATGTAVLFGWAFDIGALKSLFGPITMKANAAVGLLSAGLALHCLGAARRSTVVLGRAAATLALSIGAATIFEHLSGWSLGIDQLLFQEPPGAVATTSPGRMGPNASLCLTLSGAGLLALYRGGSRAITAAQLLGAIVATLALIPTVGYLYGAQALYAVARWTGIALHTALALLTLGLAVTCARPAAGPVAAVLSDTTHGIMARRLLGFALLLPLALGYLRVTGELLGWWDTGLGSAMFVVGMIVVLSLTIWRTAAELERTSSDLHQAEHDRDALLLRERAARQKAEQADRAKDEFIAALSHELRTPLNAILGWMYMLRNEAIPQATRGRAADAVVRNAALLARLIEDLLDTSRITTGQLTLASAPVDIRAVVQAAIESILPASEEKNVPVELTAATDLPVLTGDSQRLQQVLWNLLSNAIKFSASGAPVHVDLRADDGTVVVTVRDTGRGIAPAFLPYVFDRFQQADASTSRMHGGLGLGLYIAHHLTELHGGTLHAHSDGPGQGAVFTLRIPAPSSVSVA